MLDRMLYGYRLMDRVEDAGSEGGGGGAPNPQMNHPALKEVTDWKPPVLASAQNADEAQTMLQGITDRVAEIHKRGGDTAEYLREMGQRVADAQQALAKALKKPEPKGWDMPPSLTAKMAMVPDEDDGEPYNDLERAALVPTTNAADHQVLKDFQEMNDALLLLNVAWGKRRGREGMIQKSKIYKAYHQLATEVVAAVGKDLNTIEDQYGGYLVPTILSSQMVDVIEAQPNSWSMVRQFAMVGKEVDVPRKDARATSYRHLEPTSTQQTDVKESRQTFGQIQLRANDTSAATSLSDDLSEDAVVAVVQMVREDISAAINNGRENAFWNADSASADDVTAHMDYNPTQSTNPAHVPDTDDVRTLPYDGVRQLAIKAGAPWWQDGGDAVVTGEDLVGMIGNQGVYAQFPPQTAYFWATDFWNMAQMLLLKDSAGNALVQTVDVYGPTASIVSGQLAWVFGSPLITSQYIWQTLQETGVLGPDGAAVNQDRTYLARVYRGGLIFAQRRGIRVRVGNEILMKSRQIYVQADERHDLKPTYVDAGKTNVVRYNLPTA